MLFFDFIEAYRVSYPGARLCKGPHFFRQVLDPDAVCFAEDNGSFYRVPQLTDIARPRVAKQRVEGIVCETEEAPVGVEAEESKEPLGESLYVTRPVPQRGYLDLDHVEPVKKLFPEESLLDRLIEVHIGRGQHAHIRLLGRIISHPFVLPVLKKTQKLRLKG